MCTRPLFSAAAARYRRPPANCNTLQFSAEGDAVDSVIVEAAINGTTTKERIQRLYDLMVERGIESDYGDWLKDWKRPDREVTTRVECAEYFDIRDRALLAHATQVDPDGGWFHAPRDLVREGWPPRTTSWWCRMRRCSSRSVSTV